jgi:hypothetical protein
MKKISISLCCFIAALLLFSIQNANAQVQVTKGSTHKYSVTPLPGAAVYNYNWSITPGGTSSTFGTTATSNDIVWDGAAGAYTITVYPVKPASGCAGNNQTLSITVVVMNMVWATTSSTQCPKTDNQTGDFSIVANYSGISGAWSFNYSIDGEAQQTVNVAAGNNSTVNVTGFTNASNTATADHTIRITAVTTPDNYTLNYTGAEPDAATRLYTVTVDPTPGTTGIIQL